MSENDGQENVRVEQTQGGGGPGGHSARADSLLTGIRDQRLLAMALRRGWFKGQRFATDATIKEFQALAASGDLTGRELAALTALVGMRSGDGRVEQRAVANFNGMERMNQADEFADMGLRAEGTNVNVNVTGIALETRADFYRAAEAGPAATDAASGQSPGVAGQVQDVGLRPEVGQDGLRPDGAASGTRTPAG